MSVVQHGMQTKDSAIQALKSELKAQQKVIQQQGDRLSEMEGEVKAHSTAGRMVKSELESWYVHSISPHHIICINKCMTALLCNLTATKRLRNWQV